MPPHVNREPLGRHKWGRGKTGSIDGKTPDVLVIKGEINGGGEVSERRAQGAVKWSLPAGE